MGKRKVGTDPSPANDYDDHAIIDPETGEALRLLILKTAGSRLYDRTGGQKVAIGSSSVASTAIDADEVTMIPTIDCLVKIANPAPTAAATAGAIPLAAMVPWTERITPGDFVAVIAIDTADSGDLYILPRADD